MEAQEFFYFSFSFKRYAAAIIHMILLTRTHHSKPSEMDSTFFAKFLHKHTFMWIIHKFIPDYNVPNVELE